MTATLVAAEDKGERRRVVFTLTDGAETFGPYVETRPAAEDVEAFLAGFAASVEAALSNPKPDPADELRDAVLTAPPETIKKALLIDDAKLAQIVAKSKEPKP